MAADAERLLHLPVPGQIRQDRLFRDVLDEARPEHWRRDPEAEIVELTHLVEIGLRQTAGLDVSGHSAAIGCVCPAADREHTVYAAVALRAQAAVRIEEVLETSLADGPIVRNEGRQRVQRTVQVSDSDLRVRTDIGVRRAARTGAAHGWLGVTAGALVGIERGAQSGSRLAGKVSAHRIHLGEALHAIHEECPLLRRKTRNRIAGSDLASARPRIASDKLRV